MASSVYIPIQHVTKKTPTKDVPVFKRQGEGFVRSGTIVGGTTGIRQDEQQRQAEEATARQLEAQRIKAAQVEAQRQADIKQARLTHQKKLLTAKTIKQKQEATRKFREDVAVSNLQAGASRVEKGLSKSYRSNVYQRSVQQSGVITKRSVPQVKKFISDVKNVGTNKPSPYDILFQGRSDIRDIKDPTIIEKFVMKDESLGRGIKKKLKFTKTKSAEQFANIEKSTAYVREAGVKQYKFLRKVGIGPKTSLIISAPVIGGAELGGQIAAGTGQIAEKVLERPITYTIPKVALGAGIGFGVSTLAATGAGAGAAPLVGAVATGVGIGATIPYAKEKAEQYISSPTTVGRGKVLGEVTGDIGLMGGGGFVGSRGAKFFFQKQIIKTPLREIKEFKGKEVSVPIIKNGKQTRAVTYDFYGELTPPIGVRTTTQFKEFLKQKFPGTVKLGMDYSYDKIIPPRYFNIKTVEPVIGKGPFLVSEVRQGSKIGKITRVGGTTKDITPSVDYGDLTSVQRFTLKKLVSKDVGYKIDTLTKVSKPKFARQKFGGEPTIVYEDLGATTLGEFRPGQKKVFLSPKESGKFKTFVHERTHFKIAKKQLHPIEIKKNILDIKLKLSKKGRKLVEKGMDSSFRKLEGMGYEGHELPEEFVARLSETVLTSEKLSPLGKKFAEPLVKGFTGESTPKHLRQVFKGGQKIKIDVPYKSLFKEKVTDYNLADIRTKSLTEINVLDKTLKVLPDTGRRTTRTLAATRLRKTIGSEKLDVFDVRTVFKSTPKRFSRAAGKTPSLRTSLYYHKKPIILDGKTTLGARSAKPKSIGKGVLKQVTEQETIQPLPKPLHKIKPVKTTTKIIQEFGTQPSIYAGTGQYELTTMSLTSVSPKLLGGTSKPSYLSKTSLIHKQGSIPKYSVKVISQSKQLPKLKAMEKLKPMMKERSIIGLKQTPKIKQKTKTKLLLKQKPKPRSPPPPIIPKLHKTPKKGKGFFSLGGRKQTSKLPKEFTVQVKRRGKFRTVGKARTAEKAFNIGRQVTSASLAASFRVPGAKISKVPIGFTRSKKNPLVIVEKRGLRLSKRTETKEIQRAKRKKAVKKKIKTRKNKR